MKSLNMFEVFSLLKSGQGSKKVSVSAFLTKSALEVVYLLTELGYVRGFKFLNSSYNKSSKVSILLGYYGALSKPLISNFYFYSTPSKQVHISCKDLVKLKARNPQSLFILSTSLGVVSGSDAISKNLGGLLLCRVD